MKYFQDIIAVNNCSLQTNSLTGMGGKKKDCVLLLSLVFPVHKYHNSQHILARWPSDFA